MEASADAEAFPFGKQQEGDESRMQQEFLKVTDLAEMLQLSTRAILNLCKRDSHTPLPHIRINGRSLRFRRTDVDAWLTKNTIAAV